MKVVLCPNPDRDPGLRETVRIAELLRENQCEVLICPPGKPENWPERIGEFYPAPLSDAVQDAELLITFGGDGTLLHAARAVAGQPVPILGMNLGRMGFLTDLERTEEHLVLRAVQGKGTVEKRMLLDLTLIRGQEVILRDFALNDFVVHGISRPIDLSVFADSSRVAGFSGDGIVIATPTGSTAYSMSAGGPVVDPQSENIILTPICVHDLFARSFVLGSEKEVKIELGELGDKEGYLSIDGGESVRLASGDTLLIRKSDLSIHLLCVSERSFYDKLYAKLGGKT